MIHLSIEEFAARRRTAQTRIEDSIRPLVRRALDGGVNTDGYSELLSAVSEEWKTVYADEAGASGPAMPTKFRVNVYRTLLKTDRAASDKNTVERITVWLATAILSNATMVAAKDDPEELFVEWVDMGDSHVREAHREVSGQVRPIGEPFKVDGFDMDGPGDPTAPIELWINCRCTLRPVLASEALVAAYSEYVETALMLDMGRVSFEEFRDVSTKERKEDAKAGRAMPDGSYPIDNCGDLKNAIQAIGRAKDPGPVKAHIRRRKSSLGCPDVTLPEGWQVETPQGAAMDPIDPPHENEEECQKRDPETGECLDPPKKDAPVDTKPPGKPFDGVIPWHGVLAPEDVRSGDGRKFAAGSLRVRPLPLPLTWQKTSADGHSGNVTIARIDRVERVDGEMRASGVMLNSPEADELIGLISDFGRFGVSVDADDVTFEMEDESDETIFTSARIASACVVPIPAFHEAWVALGAEPDDFFPAGAEPLEQEGEAIPTEALVASTNVDTMFVDVAPGKTEDGPGWLTHPVDTDRLRDYWVRGAGAAKIGWGTPGDFNRCRVNVAEYVKPQHINGYCANRHYDALGFWPGPAAHAGEALESTEPAESLNLVASAAIKAPHEWFTMEEPDHVQPLTITEEGQVYGHVAAWDTCHVNWQDQCVLAPRSPSNYAHFLLGEVLTTEGRVPVGCLTINGGHAGERLSMRRAIAHYDNVATAYADVTAKDGKHGIWVCGWVRPGTPEEMVVAARASKPSGDWRDRNGALELIAAHSVNTPGLPIPRVAAAVSNGRQISLVAAGMVTDDPVQSATDTAAIAKAVFELIEQARINREKVAALAARVNGSNDGV